MKRNEYGIQWIYMKTEGTRFLLIIYAILVIINIIITLSIAYFLKLFIDIATGDIDMPLISVGTWALSIIGIGGIITMIHSVIAKLIYGKIERNLRIELMSIIFSRRMVDISKQHTGELLTKLTTDIQAVSNCFIDIIKSMLGGVVSAVFATASLFFLSWKMAIIMMALIPFLMLVMGGLTPFMQKASTLDKANDEINRSIMQEFMSRIMLIKVFFMQSKVKSKVYNAYDKKLKSGMKLGFWEGFVGFAGTFVGNAMFLVAIGVGSYFVMKGETTVGSLIAIVQLLNYIVSPLEKFSGAISSVSQATASSGRIGMLYDLPGDKEVIAASPVEALEILVEELSFSYDNDNTSNILEDINASFSKEVITGIVGKSGSGKSTLLKLLIGLYSPQKGNVKLKCTSGILQGEEIMQQVAYVPPTDYLFSGSVTENIIMSKDEPDLEEMRNAASSANILKYIESLPNRFNTLIGESGGNLSSGQAQRIAIARAIYTKAPIIVFDEPTANLDDDSIEIFQSTVKSLANEKICILVTHDMSTMTICDKVYVLEQGHIMEKHNNKQ